MLASAVKMKTWSLIIAVVMLEIVFAFTLVPLSTPGYLKATDFVNFYVGASIVRHGGGAQLYRRETQDAAYQSIVGYPSNQYFLHPPFEAAALVPLTFMSLKQAFVVWMLINVALLGCLPFLLMQCSPFVDRRPYLMLVAFCFLPVIVALSLGQDSILLLFLLTASYLLMFKGRDFVAGLVLALAAIKFQYLLSLIPLLLFARKFRLLAGFGAGCGLLAMVSLWITGPRGLIEYFDFVRTFDARGGYGGLNPTLMVSARGFLAGLGHPAHSSRYSAVIGIALLAGGALCAIRRQPASKDGLAFALYVTIALAAAPYAHFPDMTQLLLPILLAIDYVAGTGLRSLPSRLIVFWCAVLFLGPYALLALGGGHYWWNSKVYLLFPAIVIFAGLLGGQLCSQRNSDREAR